ncbi:hypothetical protein L798_14226 [Zootermopsis nevadensis]|uniref:Uncharacterized protein n=1 Tax=Zootermopsis nevadensis TaxID=136037 RepID=A0A067QSQ6_ZOONE|nr:hypothetical protein L798_14226 [Zootermopsis nevadensis]
MQREVKKKSVLQINQVTDNKYQENREISLSRCRETSSVRVVGLKGGGAESTWNAEEAGRRKRGGSIICKEKRRENKMEWRRIRSRRKKRSVRSILLRSNFE